ncbi:Gfo/Idh/MocA family protein [Pedobacter miscanthi]|uniref:Gfo/Idh/MocA family oxidoreductase n=1 Tax=Pedobacter miscanthi TaxID=2259170 RepID=A0A366LF63_9SPHI|nr:Gfo/Idh/MocA family oxidoreductase [Pedobacter miscanthi]RBQ12103.1 gfo/Idh/MocA family oxidoreductase [Pedobacter miscanthi]
MEEIRWGIIGCGDVTEVKSGPAFNKVAHSKLVAVMRRDGAKAADYAKRHGVPKWYSYASELINDPEVNAIYIATPPLQHEAYTIEALQAGKPVYVEKPMTLDAAAAQRMTDAANQLNIKLCVAHYRRAQPMFLKVKELLDQHTIGDIRLIRLKMLQPPNPVLIAKTEDNWRINPAISGGGLFHDLAPHQLDLMTYYFGAVKSASGIAAKQQENTEVDDLVTGNILFENGVVFSGTWCFSVAPQDQADECVIYGSKGKISFPMFGNKINLTTDRTETFAFEPLQHVQQPMIEKVVDYFLNKGPNPCSGEDALITMKLMDDFTEV